MKHLKRFNENSRFENLDRHFDFSDEIKKVLIANDITGGNGWEDAAVTLSNRRWEALDIFWGTDKDHLKEEMENSISDYILCPIFEDKTYFRKDDDNLVCILSDEEHEIFGCFFIKEEKDVIKPEVNGVEYKFIILKKFIEE
jgi:hypothetical protein